MVRIARKVAAGDQAGGFAGAAELGDQRVALVLDVAAIVEEVLAGDQGRFLAMSDGRM